MTRLASLLVLLVVVAGVAAQLTPAGQSRVRGPFLLVSLASLGTVTWRCDPVRQAGLALGFRAFATSADAETRLIVGSRTVRRSHVVPGARVSYPYLAATVQKLEIVQGTEAGTVRTLITVDFGAPSGPSLCWPYAPPKTTVSLSTRH